MIVFDNKRTTTDVCLIRVWSSLIKKKYGKLQAVAELGKVVFDNKRTTTDGDMSGFGRL